MPGRPTHYGPAEIERLTGIPMNTLRAWERRYGVPKPQRGPGGHRIFTEADLQALQYISKQLSAGVSISHAIASLNAQKPTTASSHPQDLVEELLAACRVLDERRAERLFSDAFAFHTLERVCAQVLTPLLHGIGALWQAGEVSVAVEHFTSSLVQAQLYAVLRTLPPPPHRPLFFVACSPEEQHAIAPLMLTVLMRRAGWRALFFGANLPLPELGAMLPDLQPDYLVLSVSLADHLDRLAGELRALRKAQTLPPVVLGGRALEGNESLCAQLHCHYLGNDMLVAIAKLDAVTAQLSAGKRWR